MPNTEPPNIRYGGNLQVNFTQIANYLILFLLFLGILAACKGDGKIVLFCLFSLYTLASWNQLRDYTILYFNFFSLFSFIITFVAVFLLLVLLLVLFILVIKRIGFGNIGIFMIKNIVVLMDLTLPLQVLLFIENHLPFLKSQLIHIPFFWGEFLGFSSMLFDLDKLETYSGASSYHYFVGNLFIWKFILPYCIINWNKTKHWCSKIKMDLSRFKRKPSFLKLIFLLRDLLPISTLFAKICFIPFEKILGKLLPSVHGLFEIWMFEEYISDTECSYMHLFSNKRTPITHDMYINTPMIVETSFEKLNTVNPTQGHTKITNTFPVDMESVDNRLYGVIGEPGCGKTVYLETLRSYYIDQGYFPFLIKFSSLAARPNANETMTFPELLLEYACGDFNFHNKEAFVSWLNKNKNRIIILADGLDNYPSFIDENVLTLNIEKTATIDTWLSLLFLGSENSFMKELKVVFTSRPSSIHNMPKPSRPHVYYSMNGFVRLRSVLRNYNIANGDINKILKFIKSKGIHFEKLAQNPFILALISFTYVNPSTTLQFTPETTYTNLYEYAFKKLRGSSHSRGFWNDETEKNVEKFYHEVFDQKLAEFTEEYVEDHHLTTKQLEIHTWINIRSNFSAYYIESKDKFITPRHQTLMEFHIALYFITQMNITKFKELVQTKMFSGEEEDRWMIIRRFISGLISRAVTEKRIAFLDKYVEVFTKLIKDGRLAQDGNKILRRHLYSDLLEFDNTQLKYIKEYFRGTTYNVDDTDISIEVLTYFLRNIDPHLDELTIVMSGVVRKTNFYTFSEAIGKLSNKVHSVIIFNISPFDGHVESLGKIISNTYSCLRITYQIRKDYNFEDIKEEIETKVEKSITEIVVFLQPKRNRNYIIKNSLRPHVRGYKYNPEDRGYYWNGSDFNLSDKNLDINIGNEYQFECIISSNQELQIFNHILTTSKSWINIGNIYVAILSDVDKKYFLSLIKNITTLNNKVKGILIWNLLLSQVDIDEVLRVFPKVSKLLDLHYLDELSDDEKNKIMKKLEASSPPSELDVQIEFGNFQVKRIGDEWIPINV